jgi:hypothetical protein
VISCGEAACPVRAGEPRVLVTSSSHQIYALAVSADTLYWGTYPSGGAGEIRSMPLAGGPSTLLVDNVTATNLYLDGSTLYYVTNQSGGALLAAVPVTGGPSRAIAPAGAAGIGFLDADASGIYFGVSAPSTSSAPGASRIMRADRTGSGATPVVEVTGTLWGFAVDDTNVYWASYWNGGTLSRRALPGGNITTLRTSSAPITSPIADGDDVVFVEGISTPDVCQSAIWSVPKVGGEPRLISPGTSGIDVWRPVRDDARLYWGRSSHAGAILRTVKGQTPEILAVNQRSVGALVLGPADIYWIASSGSAYEVRTLAK